MGALGATYIAGAVSGALIWGYLTDRFGRKRLFMITLTVYMIGVVLTTLAWGFWSLAAFRFITGFGIGGEYAAINSAIDELIPARVRGWVDLAINGSFWLGAIVGSLLGALYLFALPTGIGWRMAFATGALLAFGILLLRRHVPESPRWLMTHGFEDEAEDIVASIESDVKERTETQQLPQLDDDQAIRIRQRRTIGFGTIARTVFKVYPQRGFLGFMLLVTQAFFYNAIFFTYTIVLSTYFGISNAGSALYLVIFAIGNFLGPLLLGRFFDTVGRVPMISGCFLGSAALLTAAAYAFWLGLMTAVWLTFSFAVIFFFASAAASAGYLTVSEIFPLEIRAMAIAFFYACATGIGGIVGPILYGSVIQEGARTPLFYGYLIGAGLMALGGLTEIVFGVRAERQSLEDIAAPLTAEEAEEEPAEEEYVLHQTQRQQRAGYAATEDLAEAARRLGFDSSDQQEVREFQRAHGLTETGGTTAETEGAIRALRAFGLGEPVVGAQRRPYMRRVLLSGLYSPARTPLEDVDIDREIDVLAEALRQDGPAPRRELSNRVGARYWGPGRLDQALRTGQRENRLRRRVRRYEAVPEAEREGEREVEHGSEPETE